MSDTTPATSTRKPVSRRLRFEILRRDNHTCRYCGAQAPDVALTVDHVIPVTLGGGNDPSNLVTSCQPCNAGKASTSPDTDTVQDVDAAAILFGKAVERAAQIRAAEQYESDLAVAQFEDTWNGWKYTGHDGEKRTIPMADGWTESIRRFYELGFTGADFERFTNIAMRSSAPNYDKFRYFCGCVWRELTDRQELARRLIEDGEV